MVKSVIKEMLIVILLVVAILLVLGILFYDYNPTTKKIPTAVETYSLPIEMQEELNETLQTTETQNLVQTYSVDREDLDGYEKTKDYEKGKPNPFSTSVTKENNSNNTSNSNNTNSNSQTNTNDNSQQGSTGSGSFLNEVK